MSCSWSFFPSLLALILSVLFVDRFDSWAGMALARASRIQEKLNSNELKSDVPIWKHSQAVLNCFKRALEIDSSNLSLWIEYGTISYALHSFASRQLKQWRDELPPEVVKQVRRMLTRSFLQFYNRGVTSCHLVSLLPMKALRRTVLISSFTFQSSVRSLFSDGGPERIHVRDCISVFPRSFPV